MIFRQSSWRFTRSSTSLYMSRIWLLKTRLLFRLFLLPLLLLLFVFFNYYCFSDLFSPFLLILFPLLLLLLLLFSSSTSSTTASLSSTTSSILPCILLLLFLLLLLPLFLRLLIFYILHNLYCFYVSPLLHSYSITNTFLLRLLLLPFSSYYVLFFFVQWLSTYLGLNPTTIKAFPLARDSPTPAQSSTCRKFDC